LKDEDGLRTLIKRTKVVISTVGPFAVNGEGIFKLCADEGKHYVDW
jgi:short subunit dehydrogenase-like uncharacterized protein